MAEAVRSEFPGLRRKDGDGEVPILADGASGSQVHEILGRLIIFQNFVLKLSCFVGFVTWNRK